MTPIEKRIFRLQVKIDKQTQKIKEQVCSICGKLDYVNGSRFNYNIDRIEHLNRELQEFKIIQK